MNRFFNWNTRFDTGIVEIDRQHRQLVDYIDQLYQAVMTDVDSSAKVRETVAKLYDYAATHLTDEEQLMQKIGFPEPDHSQHLSEHDKFRDRMRDFQNSVKNGYPVTFQIVQFLKDWLSEHILDTDKRYVEFMRQHKLL